MQGVTSADVAALTGRPADEIEKLLAMAGTLSEFDLELDLAGNTLAPDRVLYLQGRSEHSARRGVLLLDCAHHPHRQQVAQVLAAAQDFLHDLTVAGTPV